VKIPESLQDPKPNIFHLAGALGAEAVFLYGVWQKNKYLNSIEFPVEMIATMGVGAWGASAAQRRARYLLGQFRPRNAPEAGSTIPEY